MTSHTTPAPLAARLGLSLALTAWLAVGIPAAAQNKALTIGMASEATAADPHYAKVTQNDALAAHFYDVLVVRAPDMSLQPSLATSWRTLDDTTWEFKLRDDVKFSNGEPFTAKDVLFTFCRTLNNQTNVAGSYTDVSKRIAELQTPDAHTVIIKTVGPLPLMPNEMARGPAILWHGIVPHDELRFDPENGCGVTGTWPTVNDFNSGRVSIGTGPYVMQSYVKGTGVTMARNPHYWGDKPHWDTVKIVPVPNAGPRLSGLLAGDFDVIENPAPRDVPRLQGNPKFGVTITPSVRLIFLQLDIGRNPSPFIKLPGGGKPGKNPLADVWVRRALSMAIDRDAINARIMDGMATPASQYMLDGMFGALPKGPAIEYDPEGAKKLLAEAGYPNGFEMTLATPNDRYVNDASIAQAVAQYFSRIGVKTSIDAMTASIFFARGAKSEFSFALRGWLQETGEASSLFHTWVASLDRSKSIGINNYGSFSNDDFDRVYLQAAVTVDRDRRRALLEESTRIALEQLPLIPLHFESTIWAFRDGLTYEGRRDQYTMAMAVKPVK